MSSHKYKSFLDEGGVQNLLSLFNKFWSSSAPVPASWSDVRILILKRGILEGLASSYRPISILSTVRKIFENESRPGFKDGLSRLIFLLQSRLDFVRVDILPIAWWFSIAI